MFTDLGILESNVCTLAQNSTKMFRVHVINSRKSEKFEICLSVYAECWCFVFVKINDQITSVSDRLSQHHSRTTVSIRWRDDLRLRPSDLCLCGLWPQCVSVAVVFSADGSDPAAAGVWSSAGSICDGGTIRHQRRDGSEDTGEMKAAGWTSTFTPLATADHFMTVICKPWKTPSHCLVY